MRHFQGAIDQLHSIFASEAQIGQQKIDMFALQHVHRAGDVRRDVDIVLILEQLPQPSRVCFSSSTIRMVGCIEGG